MDNKPVTIEDVYIERDKLLSLVAILAKEQGYNVGIGIDENMPDIWKHVVYIDLPTGQLSWHILLEELPWFENISDYDKEWDGHNSQEKYKRLLKFVRNFDEFKD